MIRPACRTGTPGSIWRRPARLVRLLAQQVLDAQHVRDRQVAIVALELLGSVSQPTSARP
jgi:hypothetical protein